jgi:hypothetical protein
MGSPKKVKGVMMATLSPAMSVRIHVNALGVATVFFLKA